MLISGVLTFSLHTRPHLEETLEVEGGRRVCRFSIHSVAAELQLQQRHAVGTELLNTARYFCYHLNEFEFATFFQLS